MKLTDKQRMWLQGLQCSGHSWVLMSATEMGDPEVSDLQTGGLVRIMDFLDGKKWQIVEAGKAALRS